MKILIAPNSFKECASSVSVTSMIISELKNSGFEETTMLPLSDGGDGFLEVCVQRFDLATKNFEVVNILNNGTSSIPIGISKDESEYYLEVADIIGMKIIPPAKRNPNELNSLPLGELLYQFDYEQQKKPNKITIGIGGTGTSDLGLGISQKYGLKIFDINNRELELKPINYHKARKIILPIKTSLNIEAITDVEIPLIGKNGCNRMFAAQKGASAADIEILEEGAERILQLLKHDHGLDYYDRSIGAGGGLLLGLSLINEVRILKSTQFLFEKLDLIKSIEKADLIITGEGNFDRQSYLNKATGIIVAESLRRDKKVALLVGKSEVDFEEKGEKAPLVLGLMNYYQTKDESIADFKNGIKKLANKLIEKIHIEY